MDGVHFDSLTQRLGAQYDRRRGLALLASLGLLSLGSSDDGKAKKKKRKKKKVTVCFNGQTIKVTKKERNRFLLAGATLGACPTSPPRDGKTSRGVVKSCNREPTANSR